MTSITYKGIVINRDQYGVAIIDAPNILLGLEASGYMLVVDRPWLTFLNLKAASGELSSVIGPAGLPLDRETLSTTYSPADNAMQYASFPEFARLGLEATLLGINTRYTEIIQGYVPLPTLFLLTSTPVQTFTINHVINLASYSVRRNSASLYPLIGFQLLNLLALLTLIALDPTTANQIWNDYAGNPILKERWTATEGDTCGIVGDRNLGSLILNINHSMIPCCDKQQLHDFCKSLGSWIDHIDECNEVRRLHGIFFKGGSRAIVLGPRKTASNDILLAGGSLAGQGVPSPFYPIVIKSPEIEMDANCIPGITLTGISSNTRNGCYCYNNYVCIGTFHSRDLSIEPATNAIPYYTATILVRGVGPVPFVIRTSVTLGFVLQPSVSVPLPGDAILVERNPFFGRDLIGLMQLIGASYYTGILDFISLGTNPPSDYTSDVFVLGDSDGNIGIVHTGAQTQLPPNVNRRIPLIGVSSIPVVNPVVPISDYQILPGKYSVNELPYYAYWNNAWLTFQDTTIYDEFEVLRVSWILRLLDQKERFNYLDMKLLLLDLVDSRVFNFGVNNNLNYHSDAFFLLDLSFRLAIALFPSPSRTSALAILNGYAEQGYRWIGGSNANVVDSPNVLDAWLLANTWIAIVQYRVLGPFLGSVLPTRTLPFAGDLKALPLLVRIVSNPCNNPLFFLGYPSESSLNLIIAESLDLAVLELNSAFGAQPWGFGLRPIVTYVSSFPIPAVQIRLANHGTNEDVLEISDRGILNRSIAVFPGVDENFTIGPGGVTLSPYYLSLYDAFKNFTLDELGSRLKPSTCRRICKKECIECPPKNKCFK